MNATQLPVEVNLVAAALSKAAKVARQIELLRVQAEQIRQDITYQQEQLSAQLETVKNVCHSGQLPTQPDLKSLSKAERAILLSEILEAAISITGADMGSIQVWNLDSNRLSFDVQQGFRKPFLDFFSYVYQRETVCDLPLAKAERVIVEDVANSLFFAGEPVLETMLDAGSRALQTTPMFDRSGRTLGSLSTYYHRPHNVSQSDLRMLDTLARLAAKLLRAERLPELIGTALSLPN